MEEVEEAPLLRDGTLSTEEPIYKLKKKKKW
jgi:hypothetical protein